MFRNDLDRRRFLQRGVGALGLTLGCGEARTNRAEATTDTPAVRPARAYHGPNVILIRFGGGVRRLETITEPEKTFCPFVYHELFEKHGILFNNVEIQSQPGVETSHGQGTLYLLTGKYAHYEDISHRPFADRFEAEVPTLFEYFRKTYDVPVHQALIVNGEDRINEEFYTFSNHHLYGVHYRSTVLSLYRFKTFLLREELKKTNLPDHEREAKTKLLGEMEGKDYRAADLNDRVASPELDRFWRKWKAYYGTSGLVNPRGDRILTALAIRAIQELRPKLLMVNYQDTDYVHWGNKSFYTRALTIIDEGIQQIYNAVQMDEEYRNRTVFLIIPDCGRDNNRCVAVPFQHHFGSKSAHQIFAVATGPGIAHSAMPVDKLRQQISLAGTVGKLMNFPTELVEGGCLEEVFA